MINMNKNPIFIALAVIINFNLLPNIVLSQALNPTESIDNKTIAETQQPYKCNAKPYKYLKGHMLSEVLSLKLPPNTRIYRYDDEAAQYDKTKNRLNIELDDKTFVRRVYCS